jgi:hypothetical protein
MLDLAGIGTASNPVSDLIPEDQSEQEALFVHSLPLKIHKCLPFFVMIVL